MCTFQDFIKTLLDTFSFCLSADTLELLKENYEQYKVAFTVGDYEALEQIGDAIISHFIILYSYKKFPFLSRKEGVKIVARVRINYTSCQFLAGFAEELGFWDQISGKESDCTQESRRLNLLEDVFEAFIGATGTIIDENFGQGTGFIVCFSILKALYDRKDISLSYESLFDAKTRLKELCDFYKKRLIVSWVYEKDANNMYKTILTCNLDGKPYTFSKTSRTKIDSEQAASSEAIALLKTLGVQKELPEIFKNIFKN